MLDLNTNREITRSKIVELPITDTILETQNKIATEKNMPVGLKTTFTDMIGFQE